MPGPATLTPCVWGHQKGNGRCHRVVATVLVREGVVGAAYVDDARPGSDCEGAARGMLAAADHRVGSWWIGVGGISRGILNRPGFGSDPVEGELEHAQEVQSRVA